MGIKFFGAANFKGKKSGFFIIKNPKKWGSNIAISADELRKALKQIEGK